MEQRVNIEFCVKMDETPTETCEMLQIVYGDEAISCSNGLNGLNYLKMGLRIFRMIQEESVLRPLEMQIQSQMSIK
jgi:hypothetical protein